MPHPTPDPLRLHWTASHYEVFTTLRPGWKFGHFTVILAQVSERSGYYVCRCTCGRNTILGSITLKARARKGCMRKGCHITPDTPTP